MRLGLRPEQDTKIIIFIIIRKSFFINLISIKTFSKVEVMVYLVNRDLEPIFSLRVIYANPFPPVGQPQEEVSPREEVQLL